ncbi:FAD-dependent oxidoreductase [Clostridium rectalis]|uniref:FAD-dependent oxidoreductase n=1 Tax=Clostridium rectalis TaxID=2040295 RepID=UPI000F639FA0|nr:FAD-dependent oxidoreductase [Clostridium rectalis]
MKESIGYLQEIKKVYTPHKVIEEATRCLLCYDAPCSKACPANTNPAKFIRSLRFRNLKGAIETIRENNVLAGVCSRVCPHDKYCEGACSKCGIDTPVKIGEIQRYLIHYEKTNDIRILEKAAFDKEKVAIIGSGPSGLSAAANLAQKGYKVTVFEDKEKAGGWLSYGIPPYKLSSEIVDYEINYIKELGVEFKLNCKINRDKSFKSLIEDEFKAILIACGLQKSKYIDIKGKELKGVIKGVDFLEEAKINKGNIKLGNKVIVIGGGDVAIDAAATAKFLGAEDVKVVYRRNIEKMPAKAHGKKFLTYLNIPVFTGFIPIEINGKDKYATSVKFQGMFDKSKLELEADMIIFAIGQELSDLEELGYIDKNENGVIIDNNCKTNLDGIFACGDIIEGDRNVVYSVASGTKAANGIDAYLSNKREENKSSDEVATVKEEGV